MKTNHLSGMASDCEGKTQQLTRAFRVTLGGEKSELRLPIFSRAGVGPGTQEIGQEEYPEQSSS